MSENRNAKVKRREITTIMQKHTHLVTRIRLMSIRDRLEILGKMVKPMRTFDEIKNRISVLENTINDLECKRSSSKSNEHREFIDNEIYTARQQINELKWVLEEEK